VWFPIRPKCDAKRKFRSLGTAALRKNVVGASRPYPDTVSLSQAKRLEKSVCLGVLTPRSSVTRSAKDDFHNDALRSARVAPYREWPARSHDRSYRRPTCGKSPSACIRRDITGATKKTEAAAHVSVSHLINTELPCSSRLCPDGHFEPRLARRHPRNGRLASNNGASKPRQRRRPWGGSVQTELAKGGRLSTEKGSPSPLWSPAATPQGCELYPTLKRMFLCFLPEASAAFLLRSEAKAGQSACGSMRAWITSSIKPRFCRNQTGFRKKTLRP